MCELLDCICVWLLEVVQVFQGDVELVLYDVLLCGLFDDFVGGFVCSVVVWWLVMVVESMDDVVVFIIDVWCQCMLCEYVFDSGLLFDEELIGNEQVLFDEVIWDYW